jgi:hypothetical protein
MVQETRLPFSPAIPELGPIDINNKTQEKSYIDKAANNIEKCSGIMGCSNRNSATMETLERTRKEIEAPYRRRLRKQLGDLNKDVKANVTVLVPLWDAVLTLRQCRFSLTLLNVKILIVETVVAQGKVPGVSKQTDLFQDNLGHAKKPLEDMASYRKS